VSSSEEVAAGFKEIGESVSRAVFAGGPLALDFADETFEVRETIQVDPE
jgi:hypothetical protein